MAAWGGVDRVLSTEKAHRQLDDHELGDGDVHRRVVERRRGDDDRNSVCARGHVGRDHGAGVPEGPAPRADAVQVGLEGLKSSGRQRDAVDGVPLPAAAFEALQADLDRVCPGCGALRDACAVVAANVTAGAHTISIVVAPASFDDPAMHVAVSQLMVV